MDLRLVVLVCLAFVSVDAGYNHRKSDANGQPRDLGQEIHDLMNAYAKAFISAELETVADSWTDAGTIMITEPGWYPYYGKQAVVDHVEDLFRIIDYRDYQIDIDSYGEVPDVPRYKAGDVVYATGTQLAYGEEMVGGVFDPNPIMNLTAQWAMERSECGGLRYSIVACEVHYIADWILAYGQ